MSRLGPLRGRTPIGKSRNQSRPHPIGSHLTEQRRNPVRLPIFHVACPATRPTIRPKRRIDGGLIGDNLLLNVGEAAASN